MYDTLQSLAEIRPTVNGLRLKLVKFINEVKNTTKSACPYIIQKYGKPFFQLVYLIIFLLTLVFAAVKAAIFSRVSLNASSNLHNQVFRSVLSSAMWFFDTTPTGRILNRYVSVFFLYRNVVLLTLKIMFGRYDVIVNSNWFVAGFAVEVAGCRVELIFKNNRSQKPEKNSAFK